MLDGCLLVEAYRFENGGKDLQETNLLGTGKCAYTYLFLRNVRKTKAFKSQRLNRQAAIHVVYAVHSPWRPEPFGDRRRSRPNARIESLRAGLLRPHASFSTENPRLLVVVQGTRCGQRIDRVVHFGAVFVIQIIPGGEDALVSVLGSGGE